MRHQVPCHFPFINCLLKERESDKFICVFLCARRHSLPDTIKLVDKFLKKRKEFGFDVNPPSLKDESLKKHFETGMLLSWLN